MICKRWINRKKIKKERSLKAEEGGRGEGREWEGGKADHEQAEGSIAIYREHETWRNGCLLGEDIKGGYAFGDHSVLNGQAEGAKDMEGVRDDCSEGGHSQRHVCYDSLLRDVILSLLSCLRVYVDQRPIQLCRWATVYACGKHGSKMHQRSRAKHSTTRSI